MDKQDLHIHNRTHQLSQTAKCNGNLIANRVANTKIGLRRRNSDQSRKIIIYEVSQMTH